MTDQSAEALWSEIEALRCEVRELNRNLRDVVGLLAVLATPADEKAAAKPARRGAKQ